MKLLFIATCDTFGQWSSYILHVWNEETQQWEPVTSISCKDHEYAEYTKKTPEEMGL